jgi:hypothetical protein
MMIGFQRVCESSNANLKANQVTNIDDIRCTLTAHLFACSTITATYTVMTSGIANKLLFHLLFVRWKKVDGN